MDQKLGSIFSKYGRVFDLLPDMIFILDSRYSIIDHNKSAAGSTGYDDDQLSRMAVEALFAPEKRTEFMQFLRTTNGEGSIESQIVRADTSLMEVAIDLKKLKSDGGIYQVIIAKDVTEQKKKELDLLRFSNVIHYTINPIQITDANGMMVYVNPAFEKVTGYPQEELIGKNPRILNSGKYGKEFWGKVWSHILSGRVWVGKIENRRKDGNPFFSELVISPIVDQNGAVAGFLGAHRDITEQKILEQQLVRSQKMESIGTLAAGIAHEVGNPLTAISSLVQVIQRTTQDPFQKEKLELINSQINRIARIIRDLVDFSRPSTHIAKPTDISHVVKEALNIVQYGKKVKDITFSINLAPDLPPVQVVPDQVVQVFINILMNAVDALEGQPGTIVVQSKADLHFVEVKVHDSGKGIPPTELEKIFEPFYTTKVAGTGSGLGLWVSYGIVKSFGGDISVRSEPRNGSTFTIFFPKKGI